MNQPPLGRTVACRASLAAGLAVLLALPAVAGAFDKQDLPRMQERRVFWARGRYAVGASKLVTAAQDDNKKRRRSQTLTVYYVSDASYDPVFRVKLAPPIEIEQRDDAVTFQHGRAKLTLSADGLTWEVGGDYPKGTKGLRFCWIELDSIRFDNAVGYRRRPKVWERYAISSATGTKREQLDAEPEEAAQWFGAEGFEPDFVLRTDDGLRTLWDFALETKDAKGFYDRWNARLMNISGGQPTFYNVCNEVAPGGRVKLALRCRAQPEEGYPKPLPKVEDVRLFDGHVHITTVTDLRDSARMARTHGFRYGLLSILYREGEYGRHFIGDAHMFEAMRRYPDVFLGFGLVQLNERGFPGYRRKGPDTPQHVEQLWRKGCKGLKTLVKWSKHELQVDDARYDGLWAKAQELGMPIVFHTEAEGTGSSHTRCAGVAAKFPKLPVIMAHLTRRGQLETTVEVLKKHPNLYLQHMHLRYARDEKGRTGLERLVDEGLASKIVFGSDVQNNHAPLIHGAAAFRNRLKELGVDEATIERIMHGTMEGLVAGVKRVAPAGATAQ